MEKQESDSNSENIEEQKTEPKDFKELGVCDELCEAAKRMNFKHATPIQEQSLPYSLQKKDIIGLAETGSGKTLAFGIPILQALLEKAGNHENISFFALIIAPTRELCIQISQSIEAFGFDIGLKSTVIVGGLDPMSQAIALSKKPHIIVGTPGRLLYHLENTKGFSLKNLKYLVFDEADKLLHMDFEKEINKILEIIPSTRNTLLFSATMTSKVSKLQRASLKNPVKIEVSSKYQTVSTLVQNYLFIPAKFKEVYLVYLLNEFAGSQIIIFSSTVANAHRLCLILRNLGFNASTINGQMNQNQRLGALNKFKTKQCNILIATEVAARGLDIPSVDVVINYDVPQHPKDYIHRVGRTARAGKGGKAVTIVTQYDVENYQKIEFLLGFKLDAYQLEESDVMIFNERVSEAQKIADQEIKTSQEKLKEDSENPESSKSSKNGRFVKNKQIKKNWKKNKKK